LKEWNKEFLSGIYVKPLFFFQEFASCPRYFKGLCDYQHPIQELHLASLVCIE
jgi:hypothetical protein